MKSDKEIKEIINEQVNQLNEYSKMNDEHQIEILDDKFDEQDRYQRITPDENAFKRSLTEFLTSKGYNGELAHGEELIISKKQVRKLEKKLNIQSDSSYQDSNPFRRRVPDFYFVVEGLVIEIDGACHDTVTKKIRADFQRISDYKSLDIEVYVIPSKDVYSSELKRHLSLIYELLMIRRSKEDFKQIFQRRRTNICRIRKAYRDYYGRKVTNRKAKILIHPSGNKKCVVKDNKGYRIKF